MTADPLPRDVEHARQAQRLAYACAEAIANELREGMTERDAARRMRAWLEARGVDEWFHLPFAWFGDRTAFQGFRQPFDFLPTARRLESGMAFILDCAPVLDGVAADIGYSSSLGPNAIVERILDDLVAHRALILEGVRARKSLAEVYREVDQLALKQGLRNRHRQYPGRVLAHRLAPLGRRIPGPDTLGRFGLRAISSLAGSIVRGRFEGWSPLWSDASASEHPPVPGLWAVEPHFAFAGVGAKFEEILVVTQDDVHWLDDDVPHVRRAAARSAA